MIKNEVEFQRTGRNKSTQVNNGYINGGEYRKKFDSLSDSKELNRLVYQLAKKMLEHRAGTEYEDMYWIDLDTLTVVAKKLNLGYNDCEARIITLQQMQETYEIVIKEVMDNDGNGK